MRSRGNKFLPLKTPRQPRARITVEAILQAAAYILEEKGWPAITTNRVAERAGVNIASLYQYFPNKESLLAELRRRHVSRAKRGAAPSPWREGAPLQKNLSALVHATIAEHRDTAGLHRALSEVSTAIQDDDSARLDREAEWLRMIGPYLDHSNVEMVAFVSRHAALGVIHAVTRRPELLNSPQFAEELTWLLVCYLRRPRRRK